MSERVAILGAGVSGQAAARLVESLGQEPVLYDQNGHGDSELFTESELAKCGAIILSPGLASRHPWRQLVERSEKPCYGEVGYAARHWKGKIIAITGTNGKSTLTKVMTEALHAAGETAVATGNIGYPFSDAVLSGQNIKGAFAIVEVSSFQAEFPFGLKIDGLIWTNFAEDHLDRYESMSAYFAAKANLFHCLREESVCVVGSQVSYWMRLQNCEFNACSVVSEDSLLLEKLAENSPFKQFPQTENFSLLAELWWMLNLPEKALIETANFFVPAAHRLKCEATWQGISFWNDSKATNFHATLAALTGLTGPIFWIGGGQMKGGNVEAFAKQVAIHISGAFVYGEAGSRVAAELKKLGCPVVYEEYLEGAVFAAVSAARGVDSANVLLSPGFSSFDQFSDYESRGKCFISTVLGLNGAQVIQ
ncbi:MAG: UDP-N-acetylmuramoyl-L-alanine--D-glutamate ligase [Lentimonas sp.]